MTNRSMETTAAGFWTCVLIVWRIFDKEGTSRHGQIAYTSGIEWGIFVALAVAGLLAYAGSRIRIAHVPEPPLPGEPPLPSEPPLPGEPPLPAEPPRPRERALPARPERYARPASGDSEPATLERRRDPYQD